MAISKKETGNKSIFDLFPVSFLVVYYLSRVMDLTIRKTECPPKTDFGPAKPEGRSQTRPVEVLGGHSFYCCIKSITRDQ